MTRTALIDPPRATDTRQFLGLFRISRSRLRFPGEGTPVMIEANGRGVQITVGDTSGDRYVGNCLILNGHLDASTGHLRGAYDDQRIFDISLGDSAGPGRRLRCVVNWQRDGCPASSEWDADEDGPG